MDGLKRVLGAGRLVSWRPGRGVKEGRVSLGFSPAPWALCAWTVRRLREGVRRRDRGACFGWVPLRGLGASGHGCRCAEAGGRGVGRGEAGVQVDEGEPGDALRTGARRRASELLARRSCENKLLMF